jgi:hypothetical protein
VGFGGGEEEKDMGRRLFQGLEKGIEGFRREHMDFINDVDFEPSGTGHILNIFPKLTDLINASVGGPIDFKDIHGNTFSDFVARSADIAWRRGRALVTVHGLGHNAGHRRLPDPSGAGKQERMRHLVGPDSVLEGLRDVTLSHDFLKGLRTIFSC